MEFVSHATPRAPTVALQAERWQFPMLTIVDWQSARALGVYGLFRGPTSANDAFDPALWETFVSTTLGLELTQVQPRRTTGW